MTDLASSYDPKSFESRLYAQWEAAGYFKPSGRGEPYTVLLPPPNVTGTLHMGHAFQHTLMDALVRYHRMRGYDTLWQMGTDHAGIATEMVVSRNLALEGKGETRDSLGRDGFIAKVWEWKAQSGDTIERQMRRMGASGDWSRSTFTMDEDASKAVIEAFVRWHEQGLIYRGQRLVNWDPVLKTAISDLEVENVEEDGFLWSIEYPLAEGTGSLVVATTRPETMLGDTAVMVHPEDERYAHLIGKTVKLPLTDREIPIIADDYVDREFGTGVVKVTPAHDFNDYQVGLRHGLPMINIFAPDASVWAPNGPRKIEQVVSSTSRTFFDFDSQATTKFPQLVSDYLEAFSAGRAGIRDLVAKYLPEKFHGLDRYDARKAVLSDLEDLGLLVETKPHKLQVPRGDRTGQVIEPYLTDQWFVKMDGLAKRGLELVESGEVKFVPSNWINTYRHWMENIQDWCISRQLWWGHQIPAWHAFIGDTPVGIYVGHNEVEARKKAETEIAKSAPSTAESALKSLRLEQDPDVLETWFSSQLWPFSTMGWPNADAMKERGFDRYLPSSVLVTGFDIIFFWVARMVMATDSFVGQVPFRDVYMTGLIRDKDGQKMSKSKGNVLDPLDIIDGISLEDLVAKRTGGLMQPKMAEKIEKATRKEFPDGIVPHGADALRFTIAALATHGRDIKFDMGRAEGYKNFCNKLWNATRFVLMNTDGFVVGGASAPTASASDTVGAEAPPTLTPVTDAEKWILSRLAKVTAEVETQFAAYRFDLLSQALYEFAWNEFCDWFVELAKPALNGDDDAAADSTRHTLLYVLEALLRLLHPLTPFVTEELWQQVAPKLGIEGGTVSLRPYPTAADFAGQDYAQAEADVEWLKTMVSTLRRVRSELNVSPAKTIRLLLQDGHDNDRVRITRFASSLAFLLKLDDIAWLEAGADAPASAAAVVGELKLLVPLEGLVDLDAERTRLDKDIARVAAEKDKSEAKLAKFTDKVPAAVVEQERQRLADWSNQLVALHGQRAKL